MPGGFADLAGRTQRRAVPRLVLVETARVCLCVCVFFLKKNLGVGDLGDGRTHAGGPGSAVESSQRAPVSQRGRGRAGGGLGWRALFRGVFSPPFVRIAVPARCRRRSARVSGVARVGWVGCAAAWPVFGAISESGFVRTSRVRTLLLTASCGAMHGFLPPGLVLSVTTTPLLLVVSSDKSLVLFYIFTLRVGLGDFFFLMRARVKL